MKAHILAAFLITFSGPCLAQSSAPSQMQTSPAASRMQMPMAHMQSSGMMGGPGMADRLSPEDMSALIDAHIAALKAGLKLSPEQEKIWPPVEEAMRNLAQLHVSHMQSMRRSRDMIEQEPVDVLRSMAGWMSQCADAMRKLADAAAPLYASLNESQRKRLPILMRMGAPGMMVGGMMGRGSMMPTPPNDDDDEDDDEVAR